MARDQHLRLYGQHQLVLGGFTVRKIEAVSRLSVAPTMRRKARLYVSDR